MRIGILKCGQSPEVIRASEGDYDDMFVRLLSDRGFEFASYFVEAMEFPGSIHDADGWLITGSRHGVYDDLPFIRPLEEFIRSAFDAEVPLVGICFGHQIIAQALGGTVAKFPGGWAVGAQTYNFGGTPVTLNAWHQDQVLTAPVSATVTACSEFCKNAAMVYGNRAWTVQAHPEFEDSFIDGLIEHRGGSVPAALLEQARESRGTADSQLIADQIAAFFEQPRNLKRAV